jgi:choline kinase
MKAIILTAGVGSRIRPLTDNSPKCLLDVAGQPILKRMIDNLKAAGLTQFVVITGYMANTVKKYIADNYPGLDVTYIYNDRYEETNTGYSLFLTRDAVGGDSFVKLDGDVVFEAAVIDKLIKDTHENCLTIDKNIQLDKEEVKAQIGEGGEILKVGKTLDARMAHGESIGIEKVGKETGKVFYEILERDVVEKQKWQEYYDDSYTTLVAEGHPFYAVDISGLKWVEIDTHEDYDRANEMFK